MKTPFLSLALLTAVGLVESSQRAGAADEPSATSNTNRGYAVRDVGAHHKVWEKLTWQTNAISRRVTRSAHSYVETATGLSYQGSDNQWLESREEFEAAADGSFAARKAQHQLLLAANLNTPASVQLTMPGGGQRLVSQPRFLSLYDSSTGANVLIAEVKDCTGKLAGPNVVLYEDAFTDIRASIRYTFTRSGMHQDVILYDNIDPAAWGFSGEETVMLEMYSEFTEAPVPRKKVQVLDEGRVDETLEFDKMRIGAGHAFLAGLEEEPICVLKSWQILSGKTFLIESVPYITAAPLLKGLPAGGATGAARKIVPSRAELLTQLAPSSSRPRATRARAQGWNQGHHLVIDYETLNTTHTNIVISGASTILIAGDVFLNGTNTTFEGGAVLKYASNVTLTVSTPVTWFGANYRPVLMLSQNDNSVGETIEGSTGDPAADRFARIALSFDANTANTNLTLQCLRIANAKTAIAINGKAGHRLSHVQLVSCENGFALTNSEVFVGNALFDHILTNFTGSSSTGRVQHLTSDTATWLNNNIGTNLFLINCLLVSVTNLGTNTAQNVSIESTGNGVFQAVGRGYHYLCDGSTNRNSGTTGIDSTLATELRRKTTYPPLVRSNVTLAVNTTYQPQVQRDVDIPDRGFEYDPLDLAVTELGVPDGVTLTLRDGVAVGVFGENGIALLERACHVVSEGTATALNYLVRYTAVQEQPQAWGANGNKALVVWYDDLQYLSSGTFRFTQFCVAGSSSDADRLVGLLGNQIDSLPMSMTHCQLAGGFMEHVDSYGNDVTLTLNNNLFERVTLSVNRSYPYETRFYGQNNLFWNCSLKLHYEAQDGTPFELYDNVFDNCVPTEMQDAFSNGNNGYINCDTLPGSSGGDVTTNSFLYANGPLGRFYHSSTNFLNRGSRSADLAGLYYFTTQANQGKETNSVVDLGFHFVAVDGNNSPIDTDNDSVPDYAEDANGNGSVNSGETDWQSATDLGLKVLITKPKNNSSIP